MVLLFYILERMTRYQTTARHQDQAGVPDADHQRANTPSPNAAEMDFYQDFYQPQDFQVGHGQTHEDRLDNESIISDSDTTDSSLPDSESDTDEGLFDEKERKKIAAIVAFLHRHDLKGNITHDLLRLIDTILYIETGNNPETKISMKDVRKYLVGVKYPIVKHFYCPNCNTTIAEDAHVCQACTENLGPEKSFFISMSITKQIEALLKQRHLFQMITTAHQPTQNKVGDIKDGNLYQQFSTEILAQNREESVITCTFIFNTDGVRVFKSNHYDIWPLYLSLVELSEHERYMPQNMIMAALWHGPKKPHLINFTKPFYEEMTALKEGVLVQTVEGERTLKAYLLAATMDLPARALVLQMMNFNAASSCHRCYHTGESFQTQAGGTVHVYDDSLAELRSDDDVKSDARKAIAEGYVQRGVKGPSPLMFLSVFSYTKGTMIDAMHGPFLGLQKNLLTLLFDQRYRNEDFSCFDKAEEYSRRLRGIKPPMSVKRYPRGLEHLGHYKASELAMILILYLPGLYGIIPENYMVSMAHLSNALYLLYQVDIERDDMISARNSIQIFTQTFEGLYGKRYQTSNFHNLGHIPEDCENAGALWNTDCFAYENASGLIIKQLHGSRHVPNQLVSALSMVHKLPHIIDEYEGKDEKLHDYFVNMFEHKWAKEETLLTEDIYAVGPLNKLIDEDESQYLMRELSIMFNLGLAEMNVHFSFVRFRVKNRVYQCQAYTRVKKRNSYTVQYLDPENASLKYGFVLKAYSVLCEDVRGVQRHEHVARIQCLEVLEENVGAAKHVKVIAVPAPNNPTVTIPLRNIRKMCVFMNFSANDNVAFLSLIPNMRHVV